MRLEPAGRARSSRGAFALPRLAGARPRGCSGAFTLTILTNVLFFAGIDSLYQSFFQGLFLFVAVLLGSFLGYLLRRRT